MEHGKLTNIRTTPNHASKIFLFERMILSESLDIVNGSVGHLSLFRPRSNRFGVMRSSNSKSPLFLIAKGKLLMEFAIEDARVSQWRIDKRCRCMDFSMELRISLIFRSTRPWKLCPPTGQVLYSIDDFWLILLFRSLKSSLIDSQPLMSWLLSSTSNFFG